MARQKRAEAHDQDELAKEATAAAKEAEAESMELTRKLLAEGEPEKVEFGQALLEQVISQEELKKAEKEKQVLLMKQTSERQMLQDFMSRYSTYVAAYNVPYQTFTAGLEVQRSEKF